MKSGRLFALVFGTCCLFMLTPNAAWSQGGPTSGPTTGGPSSGSPSGTQASNITPQTITVIPLKTATSGAGSATSTPSNANPFVQTYGDPLSMGKPANYANTSGPLAKPVVTFAKGIYSTTAGAVPSSASTVVNPANGFTMYNVYRNPPYATVLSTDLPMVAHSATALQTDLRSIIDRSSFIRNPATVQIRARDGIVALTGQVSSDKEFRLVEGMVRTAPGVINVLNGLKVAPTN